MTTDKFHCEPSIQPIVISICKRIKMLNRQQAIHTFYDGIPDEAIEIESDALVDVLKMYERLGMLEIGSINPGRW